MRDRHAPFATLLKRYRLAAGLTQEELAERAHMSARTITALERCVNERPRRDTLRLLADALHLGGEELARFEAAARGRTAVDTRGLPPWSALAPRTPLIGRCREITLIQEQLRGEGPPLLLLAGEPGIGKTRLLWEAALQANESGVTVLWGGCQRRDGEKPYSPVLEALARHVEGQSSTQLRALLQDCDWLQCLLPELQEMVHAPAGTLAPEQERRLVFGAVARFLENVAGPAGTLLVLDDLHWAGRDALDLLTAVLQTAGEAPIRVLGAYRETEAFAGDPLSDSLGDWARQDLASRIELDPLSREEAEQLLAKLLEEQEEVEAGIEAGIKEQIVQRAEGVPFFLVSLTQALRAGAVREGGAELPWTITESIRQRVAALPREAQEVVGVAAVAGRTISRPLLTAILEQAHETEWESALKAACRAGLLREKGERGYRFAHDVIREVIEEDLGAARRAVLHREIAETLERMPGREKRAAELAWHYLAADDPVRALRNAVLAGDHAETVYAHSQAERDYRMAVALAQEIGDEPREAEALEKLGGALYAAARYDEALGALERAAEKHRTTGNLQGLGRVTAELGRVHALGGAPAIGICRLELLLPLLEEHELSRELADLYTALAHLYFVSGRHRDQLAAAERAVELARTVGDDRTLAEADVWRGVALLGVKRVGEGVQALEQAVPLTEATGDLISLSRALNSLAAIYEDRGEVDKEGVYLERALQLAERCGDPARITFLTFRHGWRAYLMGEWKQARLDLERAALMGDRLGTSWASAYPALGLGALDLGEGDYQAASRRLQECIDIAERNGHLRASLGAQALLAECDLLEGHLDAARERLDQILAHPRIEEQELARALAMLARVYIEIGDDDRGETLLAQSAEHAAAEEVPLALVESLRLTAVLAARRGSWEEAEPALAKALTLARTLHNPYAMARVFHEYAVLHIRKREPERAREWLLQALPIFQRLGARPYVEQTEQALMELG